MKTFIFIPDTNQSAGLGHLFRCYQYSNLAGKKSNIFFLIHKKFDTKYLKYSNSQSNKINYIFYTDIRKSLDILKNKNDEIYTILDSYNKKLHFIDFGIYSNKHLAILDFKIKNKADYILDHTFKRKRNFYSTESGNKIYTGHNYFPIFKKIYLKKRNIILINFGSIKNKNLILKSLTFIKNLNLHLSFKIVIINKFFNEKDLSGCNIDHEVICYKFCKNIDVIYQKIFFSIGACGISLYEKCFYHIPSISKCVAENQRFNFINFNTSNCILDFDEIMQVDLKKNKNKNVVLKRISHLEKTLKKKFNIGKNKIYLNKIFKNL